MFYSKFNHISGKLNLQSNHSIEKTKQKRKQAAAEYRLEVCGKTFRVFIYVENRPNCRASIGRRGIHIRLSKFLTNEQKLQEYLRLKNWAKEYITKHRPDQQQTQAKNYQDGEIFIIQDKSYLIRIEYVGKTSSKGTLKNGIITLRLSAGMTQKEEHRHKSYLVSRLIGNAFQPMIAQRLQYLNTLHFGKQVKKVTLRYNQTNWGSCSHDGKISISTNLLFAPPQVIDYVLIHELAHLSEHNHSKRFWALVESKMPAYRLAEKWLKENGKNCVF
jgi:hypothetical protein